MRPSTPLRHLWVAGLGLLALVGCGPKVQTVENVKRAAPRWSPSESATGAAHICLEYSTAAHELHDRDMGATIPLAEGQNVTLTYKDTESLATIYSVGEIMQFGHAALYRLCEASGNQSIDAETYQELFSGTIDKVHGLIELQLLREKLNSLEHLMVLRSQLSDLDKRRCELSHASRPATAREIRAKNAERVELVKRLEGLAKTLDAPIIPAIATADLPSQANWKTLNDTAKVVEAARRELRPLALKVDPSLSQLSDDAQDTKTWSVAKDVNTGTALKNASDAPLTPTTDETKHAAAWQKECESLRDAISPYSDPCAFQTQVEDLCPW